VCRLQQRKILFWTSCQISLPGLLPGRIHMWSRPAPTCRHNPSATQSAGASFACLAVHDFVVNRRAVSGLFNLLAQPITVPHPVCCDGDIPKSHCCVSQCRLSRAEYPIIVRHKSRLYENSFRNVYEFQFCTCQLGCLRAR
jgi:hypothetical protein